jgi:hypothetical protein
VHVSKDVSYGDNNIALSFVYQVLDVNPGGMFWIVTKGRYQFIGNNVFNNSQNIVVTLSTTALVVNNTVGNILMKEEPIKVSHDLKFFISIMKSSFINLCESFDEDGPSPPDVVPISMNL